MRLINDDSVISIGNFSLSRFVVDEMAQGKRKLLQGSNNNIDSCFYRICQLFRINFNTLHDTRFMFKLVNCILKLLIEHISVGDNDD